MRFIVYGVGAVGGTIAVRLASGGHEVAGIARGAQLAAIREHGLLLRTPAGDARAHFSCHADPAELTPRADDVVVLTMKTQDTLPALERLRAAGFAEQPVLCCQNGVANERFALRLFPNVYGVVVMLPADFVRPGEVAAFGAPLSGMLDIGRFPEGADAAAEQAAAALTGAGIEAVARTDVMAGKYGKLLMNLSNVLDAALADGERMAPFAAAARREAEAVLTAAGIGWEDLKTDSPRRAQMRITAIAGVTRQGSSSAQSLARGTGSIETDYLNGEIVLAGRLHGVPTPVNAFLCDLARRLVASGAAPGSVSPDDLARDLRAAAPGAI